MQHISYNISEILEIVKGQPVNGPLKEQKIRDILIDSRKLISVEECLFFAIASKRNDGHSYIKELYDKGIRNFVVSKELNSDFADANIIKVENSLKALQALARAHRSKFNIPVIGITGSNGKTIIKEWLFQLLAKDKKVVRSPKSYNSQIGVPLSVWQLDTRHEIGIFEAGISEPDEMDKLQPMIKPTIGIFTNIGEAHNENFISKNQKVGEKLKLFTKVETLVYSLDHPEIREVVIRSEILKSIESFTWSRKQNADLRIIETAIDEENKTTLIKGTYNGEEQSINIPFTDHASIENAIHCWAVMLLMEYRTEKIRGRFEKLTPIAMRLELKAGINQCVVINDSYNSDINSLTIAIDFLKQNANHKKKTLILSDILQSGRNEEELYGSISEILDKKGIDRMIGIGPALNRQKELFNLTKEFYPTTEEFLRRFSFAAFNNEAILLKGARVFEFEQISRALQQKTHETVMEINLNALIHNLNYFRSKLETKTKTMAMVKAFSYGSGSFEIANALQFHRVDYLAVAYTDEGVELRKAGIQLPIMVMNPDEQSFDAIITHNLEPEIYSFRILDILEKAIRKNIIPSNKPVKIHIKLDTGMHRLGFVEDDIGELVKRINNNNRIYTQSVFTHLAASEDPTEDDFTAGQLERFREMSSKITGSLDHPVLLHALNSAGISRHPEAQFDMVRLGIGLYGIASTPEEKGNLEYVGTLRSIISQVKKIKAGETIGYARSFKAEKDMQIGIVPVGYADGLRRSLSNGKGSLLIKNKKVPIVGNVCMDMCMVDITGLEAKEGDSVIVFGKDHPVETMAGALGTIPYEILAGIPPRVKRIFFQE